MALPPTDATASLYRPCVGIALFNARGEVFVGERLDTTSNAWQMPQGGIDEGETIQQAFFRELQEEVGTDQAEILQIAPHKLRYDLPPETADRLWKGRYIGQEQSWVAGRFLGRDTDININAHAVPEFSDWKWVRLEETVNLVVPFKRDIYRAVIEMFASLSKNL